VDIIPHLKGASHRYASTKPIEGKVEEQIIKNIFKVAKKVDAIMVGDQVSSVITPKVCQH
jgi:hypothetical protein